MAKIKYPKFDIATAAASIYYICEIIKKKHQNFKVKPGDNVSIIWFSHLMEFLQQYDGKYNENDNRKITTKLSMQVFFAVQYLLEIEREGTPHMYVYLNSLYNQMVNKEKEFIGALNKEPLALESKGF